MRSVRTRTSAESPELKASESTGTHSKQPSLPPSFIKVRAIRMNNMRNAGKAHPFLNSNSDDIEENIQEALDHLAQWDDNNVPHSLPKRPSETHEQLLATIPILYGIKKREENRDQYKYVVIIRHGGNLFALRDVNIGPQLKERFLKYCTTRSAPYQNKDYVIITAINTEFQKALDESKEYQAVCLDVACMEAIKNAFDETAANVLDQTESAFFKHQAESRWYGREKNKGTYPAKIHAFFTHHDYKPWEREQSTEETFKQAFDNLKFAMTCHANNQEVNKTETATRVANAYNAFAIEVNKLPEHSKLRRIAATCLILLGVSLLVAMTLGALFGLLMAAAIAAGPGGATVSAQIIACCLTALIIGLPVGTWMGHDVWKDTTLHSSNVHSAMKPLEESLKKDGDVAAAMNSRRRS